ncbi:MAG TPA: c-type cytochrome [Anaerolineaceae bacterium]|nr:c-type cytochrome [Anaerolineaceae bacterium]
MRRLILAGGMILLALLAATVMVGAQAQGQPDLARGARLYDSWFVETGQSAPEGDSALWLRQTNNTRSGEDTYRCVTCHGWDYAGKDGAYRSGSNYTGFPGLYESAKSLSVEELMARMTGAKDAEHNFSAFLDETSRRDIAEFLKTGLIDDRDYIDPLTFDVIGGDAAVGQTLYESGCANCHGLDGRKLTIRYEGRSLSLPSLAAVDPWRFLHKSRFGTPGNPMQTIGYDLNWTPEQGRDVLRYIQTLATEQERKVLNSAIDESQVEAVQSSGPASDTGGGILTALGAMATWLGFAILVLAALAGIIFAMVWTLRGRRPRS